MASSPGFGPGYWHTDESGQTLWYYGEEPHIDEYDNEELEDEADE